MNHRTQNQIVREGYEDLPIKTMETVKKGDSVKTIKRHTTIVNGTLEFPQLPVIEISEGVHGEVNYRSNFTGEFHVKWVEIEVETIEHYDSQMYETLKVGEE